MALHAPRTVSTSPPSDRLGLTRGIASAAMKPIPEKPVSTRPQIQVESPAVSSSHPPVAVPAMIARKAHISMTPLPADSRSWGSSSGRMPYFAGLRMALCAPIRPRTINGRMYPDGLIRSAQVPAAIRITSRNLASTMTVFLLMRSASTPAGSDTRISGSVKTANASVV